MLLKNLLALTSIHGLDIAMICRCEKLLSRFLIGTLCWCGRQTQIFDRNSQDSKNHKVSVSCLLTNYETEIDVIVKRVTQVNK